MKQAGAVVVKDISFEEQNFNFTYISVDEALVIGGATYCR